MVEKKEDKKKKKKVIARDLRGTKSVTTPSFLRNEPNGCCRVDEKSTARQSCSITAVHHETTSLWHAFGAFSIQSAVGRIQLETLCSQDAQLPCLTRISNSTTVAWNTLQRRVTKMKGGHLCPKKDEDLVGYSTNSQNSPDSRRKMLYMVNLREFAVRYRSPSTGGNRVRRSFFRQADGRLRRMTYRTDRNNRFCPKNHP